MFFQKKCNENFCSPYGDKIIICVHYIHNADIQITASLPAYRMVLVFWIERNGKDNGLEKEFNIFFSDLVQVLKQNKLSESTQHLGTPFLSCRLVQQHGVICGPRQIIKGEHSLLFFLVPAYNPAANASGSSLKLYTNLHFHHAGPHHNHILLKLL